MRQTRQGNGPVWAFVKQWRKPHYNQATYISNAPGEADAGGDYLQEPPVSDHSNGPVWFFEPMWNKVHYNQGDYISNAPGIGNAQGLRAQLPDGRITDTHQPWCAYWFKGSIVNQSEQITNVLIQNKIISIGTNLSSELATSTIIENKLISIAASLSGVAQIEVIDYNPGFFTDSACVALWDLDSGALTTDSKSTNTLTNVNTVSEDTTNMVQGDAAGSFAKASNQFLKLESGNRAADFPLGTGDTTKIMTICGWFRPASLGTEMVLFGQAKRGTSAPKGITVYIDTSSQIVVRWGRTSGSGYNYTLIGSFGSPSQKIQTDRRYHLAIAVNGTLTVSPALYARIYDETRNIVYENTAGIGVALAVGSDEFRIGAYNDNDSAYTFDGMIDEVVVFNRFLAAAEIDAIRTGSFS